MGRGYAIYCAAAGACDTSTGVLLVAAPAWTLRLMGVASPPAEPVFVRFIGAFVTGVGLCYFLPWLEPRSAATRLSSVLLATAVIRLCVALFVGGAVLRSALAPPWSVVFVTDFTLGVAQLLMVRAVRGR